MVLCYLTDLEIQNLSRDSIQLVKELVDLDFPIFGICLGHQILALSQGLIYRENA